VGTQVSSSVDLSHIFIKFGLGKKILKSKNGAGIKMVAKLRKFMTFWLQSR
jgi:hypothetical protein